MRIAAEAEGVAGSTRIVQGLEHLRLQGFGCGFKVEG